MRIGTNWTTLRVFVQYTFTDSGANVTGTPRAYLGVMAGNTAAAGPLASTTLNFVGAITTGATWTRSTSNTRYVLTSGVSVGTKIGSTITATAAVSHFFSADTSLREVWGVEITKGSPNFVVQTLGHGVSSTINDNPLDTVIASIEADTMANARDVLLGVHSLGTAANVAVDEATNGYLDSIVFAFDRTSPEFQVSAVLYAKKA